MLINIKKYSEIIRKFANGWEERAVRCSMTRRGSAFQGGPEAGNLAARGKSRPEEENALFLMMK